MRFVKCAQFAVGFAAFGGAVVVMAGSALAADAQSAGSVETLVQNTSVEVTNVAPPSDGAPPSADGTSASNIASSEAPTVSAGSDAPTSGTQSSAEPTAAANNFVSPMTIGISDGPGGLVGGQPLDTVPVVAGAEAAAGTGANGNETTAGSKVGKKIILSGAANSEMVMGSKANWALGGEDLAPSASPVGPTLPTLPTPAKSSGALGRLTAVLAGVIVPPTFAAGGDLALGLRVVLRLMAGGVLLVTVFMFTYGLWLRRGGFVTAARGDASLAFTLFFATPHTMGYVPALQRQRSPFNVVAEMKNIKITVPNAIRKEEMI